MILISVEDFTIYAGGTDDLSATPQYIDNQTFRIVIVPGSFSAAINKNSYADVMAALNMKAKFRALIFKELK
jgi:isocitrate/isopropylmalate dehydrogenase